jgi:CoA:oxalate CoA-transferase
VVIACLTNGFYNRLMNAIGRADLVEDPRFATNSARIAARDEFLAIFEPLVREHTCDYWLQKCAESDTPACRVNELEDVFDMPQVLNNEIVVNWEKPGYGPFRTHNVVFRMSETPGSLRIPPPTLCEHTDDVLRALGKTPDDIADLRDRGICG